MSLTRQRLFILLRYLIIFLRFLSNNLQQNYFKTNATFSLFQSFIVKVQEYILREIRHDLKEVKLRVREIFLKQMFKILMNLYFHYIFTLLMQLVQSSILSKFHC